MVRRYLSISLLLLFSLAALLSIGRAATDKTPSMGTFTHSTPNNCVGMPGWWYRFIDEHVDWMTTSDYCQDTAMTRGQPTGTYETIDCLPPTQWQWALAYMDSGANPIHRDSALGHFRNNTIVTPNYDLITTFVPGWNPANDPDGNWQRNYDGDWDENISTNHFTVQRTSSPYYIYDAGGGRAGISWTTNKWQNAYIKMGTNSNSGAFATTVTRSTGDTLFLNAQPTAQTYTWFIVDDPSAVDHDAIAMRDTCARILSIGSEYRLANVRNWKMRAFAGHWARLRLAELNKNPGDIYPDDVLGQAPGWDADWNDDYLMGGACAESLDVGGKWRVWNNEYCKAINDSLPSGRFLLFNLTRYNTEWDTICMNHAINGMWHEKYCNISMGVGNWAIQWEKVKQYRASPYDIRPHFFHFEGYPELLPGGDTPANLNRDRMFNLACYYVIKDDSSYFLYQYGGTYGGMLSDTNNWWFGLMGVDMGTPTDTANNTGGWVWERPFTKGYVIVRLADGLLNFGDPLLYDLPGYYFRLYADGTAGDSTDTVTLNRGQAFFGLSTTEYEPPVDSIIQYVVHKETTTTSFTVRDSLITIPPTPDSAQLWIATLHSFADSTKKARFGAVIAGNLQASGLVENTKYYFKCAGWKDGKTDYTVLDSITTEQIPAPPDTTRGGVLMLRKR